MNNSEEERNINLAQKLTQAWQEMIESGQLSIYMAMSHEEVKKLQETDEEEIGKNEHIVAYLRAVRKMCQK
ncbi:MAG: hypothetical protein ACOX5S_00255 [Patescibacteria group bacterium]|jgi:hypothetical protein